MDKLVELLDQAQSITANTWNYLVCVLALLVAWRALGIVSRALRNKKEGANE